MNRSRADRRRLQWARYYQHYLRLVDRDHLWTGPGFARADRPFYRSGARHPYGWRPGQ